MAVVEEEEEEDGENEVRGHAVIGTQQSASQAVARTHALTLTERSQP